MYQNQLFLLKKNILFSTLGLHFVYLHFIEPLLKCICQEIGMDFLFQIMKFGIVIFFNLAPTGKKNKYNFIINFSWQLCIWFRKKKIRKQRAASSEHNSEKATLFKTKIPRNLKLLTQSSFFRRFQIFWLQSLKFSGLQMHYKFHFSSRLLLIIFFCLLIYIQIVANFIKNHSTSPNKNVVALQVRYFCFHLFHTGKLQSKSYSKKIEYIR